MIIIPPFNGVAFPIPEIGNNYAVENYEDYLTQLNGVPGYTKHKLADSYGGTEVYGYSLGDLSSKPVILIDGCIHKSHEWRTSYWIMHFMEVLNQPNLYPEMADKINELKAKYSFYFLPVVAPDCFIASSNGVYSYGSDNGVDIAQNFDFNWASTPIPKGSAPFSEPEARNIRDVILEYKPVVYINCHGYGDADRFVIRQPRESAYVALYEDLNKSLNMPTSHKAFRGVAGLNTASSSYNWASSIDSGLGRKVISNVFEVGVLENSVWQSKIGVTGLMLHILHADNYLSYNSLRYY